MIVGIDEVGRGPWAGPLVIGAVILGEHTIDGLTDSKKLTKKRRESLNELIYEQATAVGLGWVQATEIDELGLSASLTLACRRALEQINVPYHQIIIDGTVNFLKETGKGPYVTTMKKADLLIPSVSAASIVAKVARDQWMEEQAQIYPEYGFESHVGYGTAKHLAAIKTYGPTPLHRMSFAPLQPFEETKMREMALPVKPTTKRIGDAAESLVAEELAQQGYAIVARNWKTKFCEIDIIAEKEGTIYFCEVKHRNDTSRGGGIAAITAKKLQRMGFAAELYRVNHAPRTSAQLMVATTTGTPPALEQLLKIS